MKPTDNRPLDPPGPAPRSRQVNGGVRRSAPAMIMRAIALSAPRLLLLCAPCLLPSCTTPRGAAFGLRYYSWTGEGVDTFAGTVTKDLVPLADTTAPLQLSANQLSRLRDKALEIGFFELPDSLAST